jgi:hypothetical protein
MKVLGKDFAWLVKIPYFSIIGFLALLAAVLAAPFPSGMVLPSLLSECAVFVVLGVALMRESKNAFPVFLMALVLILGQVLVWESAGVVGLASGGLVAGLWLLFLVQMGLAVVYLTNYKLPGGIKGEVFSSVVVWVILIFSFAQLVLGRSGWDWGLAIVFVSIGAIGTTLKSEDARGYGTIIEVIGVLLALVVVFVAHGVILSLI